MRCEFVIIIEMTEKETIEALYRSSRDRLQSLAQSILKSQDEATDAVGDMFAKLADGQLTLPAEKQESYLMVSLRNLCIDQIRLLKVKHKLERHLTLSAPRLTPVETEQELVDEMMDYAEQTLTPQQWRIFRLRFDEQLSYLDIARQERINVSTVYRNLVEALKILKHKYNPVAKWTR